MSLEKLFADLRDGTVELTDDLPIFTTRPYNNPVGAWSWDVSHAIVGTCVDDLEIVPREDDE